MSDVVAGGLSPAPTDDRPAEPGTAEVRWREDLPRAVVIIAGSVLLGAPAGLLWSKVAPRLTVTFEAQGPTAPDLESTKAFIGADASYLLVMLALGLLCGGLAWLFARRSGPWTVAALAAGGVLAALVAARVGLVSGSHGSLAALRQGTVGHAPVDLYLGGPLPGQLTGDVPHLRAPWAAVAWPVGAMVAFLAGAAWRPEELD